MPLTSYPTKIHPVGVEGNFLAVGVDGCKGGWVAVGWDDRSKSYCVSLFSSFSDLLHSPYGMADFCLVDIPIGLPEVERRPCDQEARKALGQKRGSSIFPAPKREMLNFKTYQEANQWGKNNCPKTGGGLSKQSWFLFPKIREVDASMSPALQKRIKEGHPEIAFMRLNDGQPMSASKKSPDGQKTREFLLEKNGVTQLSQAWGELSTRFGRKLISYDDFLDAYCLCLSAKAHRMNQKLYRFGTAEEDSNGLSMEIWG